MQRSIGSENMKLIPLLGKVVIANGCFCRMREFSFDISCNNFRQIGLGTDKKMQLVKIP